MMKILLFRKLKIQTHHISQLENELINFRAEALFQHLSLCHTILADPIADALMVPSSPSSLSITQLKYNPFRMMPEEVSEKIQSLRYGLFFPGTSSIECPCTAYFCGV
jgi:hypothetical protein